MNETRELIPAKRSRLPTVAGYAALAWALVFGVVHVYWAVGGTVGLQGHSMTGLLFVINLVAIPLCLIAAVVAVALVESWAEIVPHRLWLTAAWGACTLLALRGAVGIVQSVLSPDSVPLLLVAYDTWFLLGGVLFGMAATLNRRE